MSELKRSVCVETFSEIASLYDAFLIDQWGVIHDGKEVYSGARETLNALIAAQKKVIILTNSSKPNAVNIKRLDENFRIGPESYTAVISSAQILIDSLTARQIEPWAGFGKNVYVVADGKDGALIENTDLKQVPAVADADVVMLLSICPGETQANHQSWINDVITHRKAVVCPSADALSVSANKGVVTGMASIVSDLRKKGALVINVGKPETVIYQHCASIIGDIKPERVLAIGDQIASDILGAKQYGFAAALVATGATPQTFPGATILQDIADACYAFGKRHGYAPDWVVPCLQWQKPHKAALANSNKGLGASQLLVPRL